MSPTLLATQNGSETSNVSARFQPHTKSGTKYRYIYQVTKSNCRKITNQIRDKRFSSQDRFGPATTKRASRWPAPKLVRVAAGKLAATIMADGTRVCKCRQPRSTRDRARRSKRRPRRLPRRRNNSRMKKCMPKRWPSSKRLPLPLPLPPKKVTKVTMVSS